MTRTTLARESPFNDSEKNVLNQVYEKYGKLDGVQLSAMGHTPGGPWDKTWRKYRRQAMIPDRLIQRHFRKVRRQSANKGRGA